MKYQYRVLTTHWSPWVSLAGYQWARLIASAKLQKRVLQ